MLSVIKSNSVVLFLLQFYHSKTTLLISLPSWKIAVLGLQIWVWEGCVALEGACTAVLLITHMDEEMGQDEGQGEGNTVQPWNAASPK